MTKTTLIAAALLWRCRRGRVLHVRPRDAPGGLQPPPPPTPTPTSLKRASTPTSSKRPRPTTSSASRRRSLQGGGAARSSTRSSASPSSSSRKTTSTTTSTSTSASPRRRRRCARRRPNRPPCRRSGSRRRSPRRRPRRRRSPRPISTDLQPPRVSPRFRLEPVAATGLPAGGMWRSSFVMADMNGDKIPDIVSPPARIGGSTPRVWIGDGQGKFSDWPIQFTRAARPVRNSPCRTAPWPSATSTGTETLDVVSASHAAGLVVALRRRDGGLRRRPPRPARPGLLLAGASCCSTPTATGSSTSWPRRDVVGSEQLVDREQVRLYLFKGRARGWEYQPEGIVGGFYSNSLHAWDYDGDRKLDVLTGSHYVGALTLLWKNQGNGKLSPDSFPADRDLLVSLRDRAGHVRQGPRRRLSSTPINMFANDPETLRATGLTVYARRGRRMELGIGSGARRMATPCSTRRRSATSTATGSTTSSSPTAKSGGCGSFSRGATAPSAEVAQEAEPALNSPGQCVRLADLNGDGRLDVILAKTVSSNAPDDPGGWSVYLNRR